MEPRVAYTSKPQHHPGVVAARIGTAEVPAPQSVMERLDHVCKVLTEAGEGMNAVVDATGAAFIDTCKPDCPANGPIVSRLDIVTAMAERLANQVSATRVALVG